MSMDKMRTITAIDAGEAGRLWVHWSDGTEAMLSLDALVPAKIEIGAVSLGDWGHSLVWPNGFELGADRLWLETLSANGHDDARQFLEWRLRHGLSLSKAADALGLARRTVAYYSNGDRPVPKAILLACRGWEAAKGLPRAA
jgi:hypothetical protein